MAVLDWDAELRLDHALMDATHVEFVDLLNALGGAAAAEQLARLDDFILHTERHFGDEERWMRECQFPPQYCHASQHELVLNTAREVRRRIAAEGADLALPLARAVAEWFRDHVVVMDAMLEQYMRAAGYQPVPTVVAALDETPRRAGAAG